MILFLNLVSDGLPYLALAFEAKNGDLLLGKIKREKVLEYKDWCFVGLISGVVGILALSLFGFGFLNGDDLVKLRGMVMMVLGVVTLLMVFLLRDFERPVWKVRFWSNWWLNLAVFLGLVMLVVVGVSFFQVRIDLEMCLSVLGVFLVSVFLVEFLKWRLFYRRSFVN
jgi:Ca2+-transporting ATPase